MSTFHGGYYFGKFLGTPRPDIVEMGIPEQVILPLKQGFGYEVKSLVQEGDQVIAGQIIGKDDDSMSTPIHATISGKIKEITEISHCGNRTKAVIIQGDGTPEYKTLSWAQADFEKLTREQIGDLLYLTGVSALGTIGLPTFKKSSPLDPNNVKYLVIAALQSNPFAISASIWDEGKLDRFALGIKILRKLYNDPVVYIGISKKDRDFSQNLNLLLSESRGVHLVSLRAKYPQEFPEILIETLTGVAVPDGKTIDTVGAVAVDIPTVLAAYDAVALGKPLISRTIALTGSGYRDNLLVRLRIGTPLHKILLRWGKSMEKIRYLFNDVLTGNRATVDSPIGREVGSVVALEENCTRRFLFFLRELAGDLRGRLFSTSGMSFFSRHLNTDAHGMQYSCIHCSYCENVCPRYLLPHLLSYYCRQGMEVKAKKLRIFGCIACGLCTYVCPSKIPVMTDIQDGIDRLKKQSFKKSSDHAHIL